MFETGALRLLAPAQARPDALPNLKSARTWDDVFEHIVPSSERIPLAQVRVIRRFPSPCFAGNHCGGPHTL